MIIIIITTIMIRGACRPHPLSDGLVATLDLLPRLRQVLARVVGECQQRLHGFLQLLLHPTTLALKRLHIDEELLGGGEGGGGGK